MTEKNIYIIRHGETKYNKSDCLQGSSINASLNKLGKAQSAAFYNEYKHIKFDKIYTSILKRSIESVQLFAQRGVAVDHYKELNEINWGTMEGKVITDEAAKMLDDLMKKWQNGHFKKSMPGGESPYDVAVRQKRVIDIIFYRKDEKNIIVSIHGRALRVFLCLLLNDPLTEMENYPHDNLGLYLLHFDNTSQKPTILKHNCTNHLKKLIL